MSGLTRVGTAEPVSRDQIIRRKRGQGTICRLMPDGTTELISRDRILRRGRGQGKIHFSSSADHEQDWQPYSVDPYYLLC